MICSLCDCWGQLIRLAHCGLYFERLSQLLITIMGLQTNGQYILKFSLLGTVQSFKSRPVISQDVFVIRTSVTCSVSVVCGHEFLLLAIWSLVPGRLMLVTLSSLFSFALPDFLA